ncbi:MAG: hypothetical protein AABZ31_13065 [Bdellovibrionota bacterium]
MSFEERSYNSELYRPKPEVIYNPSSGLLVVATPWGPRPSARKAAQFLQDFLLSAREDSEATSPFAKLSCLSPLGNQLRLAVKMTNDLIYQEDNKQEYVSGIELTVVLRNQYEVAIAQFGHPFLLLDRPATGLTPLGSQIDLSSELSFETEMVPPLPSKLLGVDPTSDFAVQSIRYSPGDRYVLISRSSLPAEVYALPYGRRALHEISQTLSKTNERMPFWLGSLTL